MHSPVIAVHRIWWPGEIPFSPTTHVRWRTESASKTPHHHSWENSPFLTFPVNFPTACANGVVQQLLATGSRARVWKNTNTAPSDANLPLPGEHVSSAQMAKESKALFCSVLKTHMILEKFYGCWYGRSGGRCSQRMKADVPAEVPPAPSAPIFRGNILVEHPFISSLE